MGTGPRTRGVRLDGRLEQRVPARIEVLLRKADGSDSGEILFTDNIARSGVGFYASRAWRRGEEVLIKALRLRFQVLGRVVYSHRIGERCFATGIQVLSRQGNWAT